MERNPVMSYPVPQDFWQPVLVERGPILKTVNTGLDRQEGVVLACQNIRIPCHSLSQPVFSVFSRSFTSVFGLFTIVQESFKNMLKGLSNVV